MSSKPTSQPSYLTFLQLLTGLAIAFGLYARFKGLGVASFIDDEYYLAKSVQNILSTGLPEFASGGYYTRGLLQQYLSAAILLLPVDLEWGMRILPLLCNVLCLPAVYLIVVKVCDSRSAAYAAVILFVLSVWETEFARFARMYAPMQLVFLWYAYFWLKGVVDSNRQASLFAASLAVAGLLVHASSIVLLVLSMVPFFLGKRLHFDRSIPVIVIGLLFFLFTRYGFEFPVPVAPADLAAPASVVTSISALLPKMVVTQLTAAPIWLLAYVGLVVAVIWLLRTVWRLQSESVLIKILLLAAIVLLPLNLMALSAISFLLALLLDTSSGKHYTAALSEYGYQFFAVFALACVFFLAYLMLNDAWLANIATLDNSRYPGKSVQIAGLLFNFPEILPRYLKPYLTAIPITFMLFALAIAGGLFTVIFTRLKTSPAFAYLFCIFVFCCLFIGITGSFQKTTRYSFFFYPLLIVMAMCGIEFLRRCWVQAINPPILYLVLVVLVVGVAEDYSVRHMISIDSPETRLRTLLSHAEKEHYLPRRDFQSPVSFINSHLKDGDRVVSATTPTDIYLDKPLDYMYIPYTTNRFWERNVRPDGLDVWSDAKLLYRAQDLFDVVDACEGPVWLLVFAVDWGGSSDPVFRDRYTDFLKYTSIDGTIDVFHIDACTSAG